MDSYLWMEPRYTYKKIHMACDFIQDFAKTHLSSVNVVQDEIKRVCSLEGEMKAHQERMLQPLQEYIPLNHHMLLLQSTGRRIDR